jgi:hypothetical protein
MAVNVSSVRLVNQGSEVVLGLESKEGVLWERRITKSERGPLLMSASTSIDFTGITSSHSGQVPFETGSIRGSDSSNFARRKHRYVEDAVVIT